MWAVKYPRTPHLPWSPGISSNDKVIKDLSILQRNILEVTEKMDGENTTIYRYGIHARSLNSSNHPWQSYVKGLWAKISEQIPRGWRICGENLLWKHSIYYDNLEDYFLAFAVFNEHNECLSYDSFVDFCDKIKIKRVPFLYQGYLEDLQNPNLFQSPSREIEGYVVRINGSFSYDHFDRNVAKWVRKNHITTDEHWTKQKNPVLNKLRVPHEKE